MIRIWLICLTLGGLSGCTANRVQLPEWDFDASVVEIQKQVPLLELPDPSIRADESIVFTKSQFAKIVEFKIVSVGNYEIGQANEEALVAQSKAYNSLIATGQVQSQFAQIREQQLEQEERDHFIDNWFHRGIIVLLGIGLIAK